MRYLVTALLVLLLVPPAWAGNYGELRLNSNTIALWRFDESSGTTIDDESINNHDLTSSISTDIGIGLFANGRDVTSSSDLRTADDDDLLGGVSTWSLEMWINITDAIVADQDLFVSGQHSSSSPLVIWLDYASPNRLGFLANDTGGSYSGVKYFSWEPTNDSVWHYLVITFDGDNEVRMFLDGEEDAGSPQAISAVGDIEPLAATWNNYFVGCEYYGKNFLGILDTIHLSGVVLTAAEIKALYAMQTGAYGVIE